MKYYLFFAVLIISLSCFAQPEANYDESKIPDYTLPEVLKTEKGKKIKNSKTWVKKRRPELISLFEENIYGKVPGELKIDSYKIIEKGDALGDKSIRKQVELTFKNYGKELTVGLLIYLPKGIEKAPMFLGCNFYGNHAVIDDPEIKISESWSRNNPSIGVINNQLTEQSRGASHDRWAIEKIIEAGYGLATMFYCDIDPDKYGDFGPDFSDGVHPLLYNENQTEPLPNEWGAISAWAWGLSRAMDYFEMDADIDETKVAVMGHSRLGKTSLWAGAQDQRFAIVISNNSGCGGAALSRRRIGERLGGMNRYFKHWLCDNCNRYDYNENALPVDQHELIALIAPRPVYIASAEEDKWADPKGEFLSAYYATPVYKLFGKEGIDSDQMPGVNQPIMKDIGYHIRTGKHDVTDFDWEQYIKFANKHFGK